MTDKNFQATNPNTAILRKKYIMFLTSSSQYSSTLNKEIEQKLPSHNYGFAGLLATYEITDGSKS